MTLLFKELKKLNSIIESMRGNELKENLIMVGKFITKEMHGLPENLNKLVEIYEKATIKITAADIDKHFRCFDMLTKEGKIRTKILLKELEKLNSIIESMHDDKLKEDLIMIGKFIGEEIHELLENSNKLVEAYEETMHLLCMLNNKT
ncbi:MAG: hypothetical protein LBF23_01370 [Endomicrobium sp.]|nr:hypothetical protein [Endomicrobium sp.]